MDALGTVDILMQWTLLSRIRWPKRLDVKTVVFSAPDFASIDMQILGLRSCSQLNRVLIKKFKVGGYFIDILELWNVKPC